MVSVQFERVTKILGQSRAVDDLTLEIKPGELFFLLGPSGCGKTTALRLVAGFYIPDEGRIILTTATKVEFRRTSATPAWYFKIMRFGRTWMSGTTWPTGSRCAAYPRRKRTTRYPRPRYRADGNLRWRLPNQLSGGQQQRVALARALVIEPDVILLDEPLSNLDAKLRIEMRAQIKEIHQKIGRTMIYVTHDQAEALSMADRIAVMRRGRVVQVGTPRQLYTRPESAFVAQFIGGTNLLLGTVDERGDLLTVRTPVGLIRAVNGAKDIARGDLVFCSVRPESLRLQTEGPLSA